MTTRLALDARRAQLLEVGLELFGERPYDDVSIDEVASRVGISKGLLYHYFPSKKDFYIETLRAAAAEMMSLTTPGTAATSLDGLRERLDAYLGYIDQHANGYRTLMRSGVGFDPKVFEVVDGVRTTMVNQIAKAAGIDHLTPIGRTALRGWLAYSQAASLEWLDHRDVTREEVRDLITDALLQAGSIATRAKT